MTEEKKTYLTVVLDESGSMQPSQDSTISGYNEFMDSQQDKALGECSVTLVQFSARIGEFGGRSTKPVRTIYSDVPIDEVPPMTRDTYIPDGQTPLYDAVAQAINETDQKVKAGREVMEKLAGHPVQVGPLVIVVIMTDGMENHSHQYNQKDVFDMIQGKRDIGWDFIFIGANQDSFQTGGQMGIPQAMTANYQTQNAVRAFASMGQSMSNYRSNYSAAMDNVAAMSDEDTADAVKEAKAKIDEVRANYFEGKTDL